MRQEGTTPGMISGPAQWTSLPPLDTELLMGRGGIGFYFVKAPMPGTQKALNR